MVHIKDSLLLIERKTHELAASGFISLSEESLNIYPMPYNIFCDFLPERYVCLFVCCFCCCLFVVFVVVVVVGGEG